MKDANPSSPYRMWESPWSAWEFAHHILHVEANLVIISMAWSTTEDLSSYSREPREPDMHMLAHWVARLEPLIRKEGEGEIIIVLANRTGVEGEVVYAGTSCVLGIQDGEVKLYGVLGRGERELLTVDTRNPPKAKLIHNMSSESQQSQQSSTHNSSNSSGSKASQESDITDRDYFERSIDEILHSKTTISPVDAKSQHQYFTSEVDPEAREVLRSSIIHDEEYNEMQRGWEHYASMLRSSNVDSYQNLKSAAHGNSRSDNANPSSTYHRQQNDTPDVDSGYERPCSPKSRNASRNRDLARQSPALLEHDLAGHSYDQLDGIPAHTDRSIFGSNSAQAGRRSNNTMRHPPVLFSQWDQDSDTDSDNEIVEIEDLATGIREIVKKDLIVAKKVIGKPLPQDPQEPALAIPPTKDAAEEEYWAAELPSHSRRRAERLMPYSQVSELSARPRSTGW